ncbi:MAG: ABC transporter ATP-binding protein [Bacteroidota bacterium]
MNKNNIDWQLLMRVLRKAKPYRGVFILATILTVIVAPIATLRPFLIQKMVDDYVFTSNLQGLYTFTFVIIGVLLLEGIIRYAFIFTTRLLGQSVIRDLRVQVFNHITSLKLTYFDRTPIGTSTTRTINDIEKVNDVFAQGVINIIADLLTIFVILGFMLYSSWELTLICLVTLPFLAIATYIFKEKVKVSFQKVRTQVTKMNAFLQERITGMRTVQIFNAEEEEMKKFKQINRDYTQANLDAILYYAVFFPVVEVVSAVALGLMVWFGARQALDGAVSLGVLIAFPIYLSMLTRPMRTLADRFNTLQMGLVAAQRVFDTLDMDNKIKNTGTKVIEKLQGKINFDQVWFAYQAKDYVLKDINFQINPGETLAIVGSTGSGKSTIINILTRLYEIQKGKITVDDIDIRDFELKAYRDHLAIVLQDVFLFSGSVLENITLRNDKISKEKVIEAAKMIGAHEFIEKLPNGYDYQVMERGATLSMGQRQLISFVRALIFDPNILILDEATSSIDPETESVIQYAIEKLIAKRTSIIIAHRLSTIRHADNILVLDKGEVKEFGSHEELLKIEEGYYSKLYHMQFLEMAETAA